MKTNEVPKGKPAYLRLYEKLREEIRGGAFPCGARFPSKRVTAEETGLSLITVAHAYEILCDEGWLVSRERSGFFTAYRDEAAQSALPAEEEEAPPASDHAVSSLPFSTYSRIMRSVMNRYGDRLMMKSPNSGCAELREALAEYLAAGRGIRVSPSRIIIGSGAEYLYGLVVHMLGRDRPFALEDPCYEAIRKVYACYGVTCRMLPMGPNGIRSTALRACDAAVLHVTPFHSWPTGVTAGASKRQEYVQWAKRRNGYVVEDDFDSELSMSSKTEDTLFSLDPDRVIHLNTFTRTVSPSLRVGYMVLPAGLLPVFGERAGFLSCSVPVTEQMFLAELLRGGEFLRHIHRVRRQRRKEYADPGTGPA